MNRTQAMIALYGASPANPPGEKIVEVIICRIRKVLQPFGISVITLRSEGYYMTAEAKSKVAEYMALETQRAA